VIGDIVAHRFEVRDYLGGGAFGSVWATYDHNLRRECALKVFHPGVQVFQALFEAQILVALQGKYILLVYDADSYMDVPYIAMERVLGSTQDRMGPFGVDAATAIRWVRDGLTGLEVSHGRGLLHRDIKPANLLLQNESRVQLGDFGVASLLDANGEAPPHGDPLVRAPEMITHGVADIRSDIYSMGATLYSLLTGGSPFRGLEPEARDQAIVGGTCEPIEDASPQTPRLLVRCVRKAMNLDPGERYQTAEQMSLALSGVPTVTVAWSRIEPHDGHFACWEGRRTRGAGGFAVCIEAGKRMEVTTRRRPSGNRMNDHCLSVRGRRLPAVLRRIFRSIS
jgi:serine/threonine-protein kinase